MYLDAVARPLDDVVVEKKSSKGLKNLLKKKRKGAGSKVVGNLCVYVAASNDGGDGVLVWATYHNDAIAATACGWVES